MSCACAHMPDGPTEGIFSVDASALTFGRGAVREVGALVAGLGCRRVALFTDVRVQRLEIFERLRAGLRGIDVAVYAETRVEPTDGSFEHAAAFARAGRFDGYVSLGGGSVMDTCKAAQLLATYPADLTTYLNRPVGAGQPVPGPLPPHVACPPTSGTGSELTGIAVCDVRALHAKTGIASRHLRPTFAVIDPDATDTLPSCVAAAGGFDVLCHALEAFTARPFSSRPPALSPAYRPMSQGANRWSDLGSREAIRLAARYFRRAVADAADVEAREQLMWASTLAGLAFGNAGVHVPHAMAYAVAGGVRDFRMAGYAPEDPLIPHGISVAAAAPHAFRFTASAAPERHLEAAGLLGADVCGGSLADAGAQLAGVLERLMLDTSVPLGLRALGYAEADVAGLVTGTSMQRRLLDNAPCPVHDVDLHGIFTAAVA